MDADRQIDAIARKLERLDAVLADGAATLDGLPDRLHGMRERLIVNLGPLAEHMRKVEQISQRAGQAIQTRAAEIDAEIDALNGRIDGVLTQARSQFPTAVSAAAVAELTTQAGEMLERTNLHIDTIASQHATDLDTLAARITDIDEVVSRMTDQMVVRISSELDGLREAFEAQFIEPVRNETQSIIDGLGDDAVRHILQPLEQEAAELTAAIGDRLDALLESLAAQLRAFLGELRDALLGGDAEDEGTQAKVKEALDMLQDAIPPLKAAFDSFAALADTVGVGI